MANQDIATALQRVQDVLERRPGMGLHDDAPATARWSGGTRVVCSHANGVQVQTDMPAEFGGGVGSSDRVTPGWLFRAGLASCAATSIALVAARQGITLQRLELQASSRTDSRGMFGMAGADGTPVPAAPQDVQLHVRIAAPGVAPQRLRALVEDGFRLSPIPSAVQSVVPVALKIEIDGE